MIHIIGMAFLYFSLASCGPGGGPHRPLAESKAADFTPADEVLDFSDVRPVFAQHCSACHPALVPPNWQDYGEALPLIEDGTLKLRLIEERSMPPPDSPQAAAISDEERLIVERWLADGAPETKTPHE